MTGKDSDKDGTNAGHQNQGQDHDPVADLAYEPSVNQTGITRCRPALTTAKARPVERHVSGQ